MRRRGELVERSFRYVLDRGVTRRRWLCELENIHKRYLIHVAGFNLGVLTPRPLWFGSAEASSRGPHRFHFRLANRRLPGIRPDHAHRRPTNRARRPLRSRAALKLRTRLRHRTVKQLAPLSASSRHYST